MDPETYDWIDLGTTITLSNMGKNANKKMRKGRAKTSNGGSSGENIVPLQNPDLVLTDRMKFPRQVQTKVYRCAVTQDQSVVMTSSTTLTLFLSEFFSISANFPNSATVLAVFDQYKLDMVELTFRPRVDRATSASFNSGRLYTCIDYDDATAPTNLSSVIERPNCIGSRGDQVQIRTFKPRMAIAGYTGSVFTGFTNQADNWIDSGSNGVQHYAMKAAWTPTDAVYTYDISCRTMWSFRQKF